MKEWKVYMHTVPNGLKYIGITCERLEERWGGGMRYQKNVRFFRAIVKYGWDNIAHNVLFEGLSQREAESKEAEMIALYKTNTEEYGYNQTAGGAGAPKHKQTPEHIAARVAAIKGKKWSDESRARLSAARKGRCMGGESPFAKKVCQYDKNHNLIKVWDSQQDAARALGIVQSGISRACKKGVQKTACGYYWEYYKEGV